MDQYFGPGERVLPPSKGGTPVQSILMRCPTKAATGVDGRMQTPKQKDKEGKRNETYVRGDIDGATKNNGLPGLSPHLNKDVHADNGKESEELAPEVDLDSFSTGLRPKGQESKKERKEEKCKEEDGRASQAIGGKEDQDSVRRGRENKARHIQPMRGRLCNQN